MCELDDRSNPHKDLLFAQIRIVIYRYRCPQVKADSMAAVSSS